MPSTRAPKLNARRIAVAAALVATTSAGAVLEVLADHDGLGLGVPVHVESPENEECPAGHDHMFCQAARSLSVSAAAPHPEPQPAASATRVVCVPTAPERGLDRPQFLTASVVPRGPPLV